MDDNVGCGLSGDAEEGTAALLMVAASPDDVSDCEDNKDNVEGDGTCEVNAVLGEVIESWLPASVV